MTVDLESREGSAHVHFRAKYKQADRDRMAKAGQAMSDGSYPIADEEDLGKAIHAVGRGGASHDAIRKHIIARAKALGLSKQIPDNWNADGSLKESNALQPGPGWSVRADGRTFNDVRQAVQAAISDAVGPSLDGSGKEICVVDLTDQWAVYQVGYSGDYLQVDYTVGADGSVALGKPTKVSQVTSYQPHTGDRSLFGAPVQGRSERGELHHSPESRFMTFADAECRMESAGNGMTFRGYASIFDAPYPIHDAYGEYQETVSRGAFDTSIAQGADVVFLVNHDGAPLARTKSGTLSIRTDQKGLLTEARLDPANPRAQDLKSMVERGDMDEMSFTFRDMRPSWNDTWTERNLREVSLHHGDVSTVNFGANGATKGTLAMRSLGNRLLLPSTRQFAEALLEMRAGAALSSTATATLRHVLSLIASADTAVDEAQPLLADLLGVPNPDIAQDAAMKGRSETFGDVWRRVGEKLALEGLPFRDAVAAMARALGDVCNCCTNHEGNVHCDSTCDGTCCANCTVPNNNANADSATEDSDAPADADAGMSQLAEADEDYERRLRLLVLKGSL